MRFLLAFGKKDNDLKLWRNAVKNYGFNVSEIIVALIKAEINNQIANIPKINILSDNELSPNTMQVNLNINDDVAEKALLRIGDYQKAAYLKSLIRRSFFASSQDKLLKENLSQITVTSAEKKERTRKVNKKTVVKQDIMPDEPKIVHTSSVIIDDDDYDYDNAVGDEQAFEPTDSTLDMFAALAGE